jgi:hypothetical protein
LGQVRLGGSKSAATVSARTALAAVAICGAVSLALSYLVATSGAQDPPPEPQEIGVEWAFRPDSLSDLTDEAEATVVAEVLAVRPGEPLAVEGPTIPTELVDVRVVERVEGEAPDELTLFRIGGPDAAPTGSPAYEVGERYMLFVRPRLTDDLSAPNPDGTWIAAAPDGRLAVTEDRRLDALIAGPIANRLDGDTVAEAEAEIEVAADAEAGQ